jgi:hypothetical protein
METPALISAANTPSPNFPASPTLNATYQAPNGVTYRWNGARWVSVSPAWLRASGDTMTGPFAVTASPATVSIRDVGSQAGSKLVVTHGGDAQSRYDQYSDAGIAAALLMDFNPIPGNLAADVNVRFFRNTSTTGRKKLVFFPGDNSSIAIGGIEISKANAQVMPYGPWNFTEKMFAAGNFLHPFQLGTRRLWQNTASGQLLFKDGADPLNDADGTYLVPLASLTPPIVHTGQTGSSVPGPGSFPITVPTGISAAYVTLIGAGGGGGGVGGGSNPHAGGGGGGGYIEAIVSGLTPGQSFSGVCGTKGIGGTGVADGAKGGDSKFGNWVTALGGVGGTGVSNGNGGGGAGGGINVAAPAQDVWHMGGQPGGDAWNGGTGWGGICGGYFMTTGDTGDPVVNNNDGWTATAPGCGGGGAGSFGNAAIRSGGDGANGLIMITWI